MEHFKLVSQYAPTGDQPQAIAELVKGFIRVICPIFCGLYGLSGRGKAAWME